MKVTFDENGYVNGWCIVGDNSGAEYDPPEDFDAFLDNCFSFKLEQGKLIRDVSKESSDKSEQKKTDLRIQRERECFSVINRGRLWYAALTPAQVEELRAWYISWLKVTETLTVPERPAWVDYIDASHIPMEIGSLS